MRLSAFAEEPARSHCLAGAPHRVFPLQTPPSSPVHPRERVGESTHTRTRTERVCVQPSMKCGRLVVVAMRYIIYTLLPFKARMPRANGANRVFASAPNASMHVRLRAYRVCVCVYARTHDNWNQITFADCTTTTTTTTSRRTFARRHSLGGVPGSCELLSCRMYYVACV